MNILKIYMIYMVIYHFYQKEKKLINTTILYVICRIRKYVIHI